MNQLFFSAASRRRLHCLCIALGCTSAAQATGIDYSLTSLGSDIWRYDYKLDNTSAGPGFDEITLYFDLPGTQEIISFAVPAGWSGLVLPIDPGLPASGFVDAVHNAGLVAAGSTVSGFSVEFRHATGMTPGAQSFELAVSAPFQVVASGLTTAVPEPATYALMLSGLGVLAWVGRRPRPKLIALATDAAGVSS